MIRTQLKKLTFEEYLTCEDDTDNRYEWIDGELVALPPESELNDFIAQELFWVFAIANLVPRRLIKLHTCEIQVPILKPSDPANRYPDLVVLRPEHLALTEKRLTISLDMPPPQFVVEVVSAGQVNRENDYVCKRAQYAARGIGEYWIVDRQVQAIAVLNLDSESRQYVEKIFRGAERLESPTLPELELTPQQIFEAVR